MERSTTSGRRNAPRESPSLALIAIVVVTVAIVLVVVFRPRRHDEPAPPPVPSPTIISPIEPTKPPPATATPSVSFSADEVIEEDEEEEEAAEPPPTPGASACVRFSWRAGLRAGTEEPVQVEITVTNGCSFEVDCSGLVFEARGLRGDESVDSITGAYQGTLQPGESTLFTITLPEVGGGYDRLDVAMAS